MPRRIQLTVPFADTESVIAHAKTISGAGSIQLQKNVSVKPEGDIIIVEGTNDAAIELLDWCKSRGIGSKASTGISTSEPFSLVSPSIHKQINRERNEAILEEVESFLHKPVSVDLNTYVIMFGAGIFAATGIANDALHLAVAGFILAPGFHPLLLVSFSLVNRTAAWKQGIKQTFLMFLSLLAGAAVTGFVMQAIGVNLSGGKPAYLASAGTLIEYWATVSPTSLYVAAAAGFVGAFVASSRQPSLIPSITIAVALIPSISVVGLSLASGDWEYAATALNRWLIEVALLLVFSGLAFLLKRKISHKRQAFE